MALNARMQFFSQGQYELLRDKVFQLLEEKGARLDHPVVLQRLAEVGAVVDSGTKQVRFPRALLEKVLQSAPKTVFHAGADPKHDFEVPSKDGAFITRPGTGSPFYLDPESGEKRNVTMADMTNWVRLVDRLDGMDFCPFPSPTEDAVPTETADVHALRCVLQNTDKHAWVQPYSAESVEYLVKLAAARVGGADKLKTRPIISLITCSLTPLDFKYMDLEIMVQACPLGIPVHACSLPGAGTTAPVTMPGAIVLAAAEILTMVAVAQSLQPGAPVVGTPLIFAGDMATGSSLQSSVEAMQGKAGAVEFVKAAFGIPTHTYGWGTDSPVLGAQAVAESVLLGATVASVGGDILGGAGQLEVATVISPVQLVIDEESVGMIRRLTGGLEVSDESIAWADLLKVAPGDHFLTTKHTLKHCRDSLKPKLYTRSTREAWMQKGKKDIVSRALERYRAIMREPFEAKMSEGLSQELDGIVAAADRSLVK